MIMVYEGIRGSGADCKTISSGCVMGMRDNKYFVSPLLFRIQRLSCLLCMFLMNR